MKTTFDAAAKKTKEQRAAAKKTKEQAAFSLVRPVRLSTQVDFRRMNATGPGLSIVESTVQYSKVPPNPQSWWCGEGEEEGEGEKVHLLTHGSTSGDLEEAAEPPDIQAVLPAWEASELRGHLHSVLLDSQEEIVLYLNIYV